MVEEKDKDPNAPKDITPGEETEEEEKEETEEEEKEEGFIEIDGEKFKEDPDNPGEALKDDKDNPIPFEEEEEEETEEETGKPSEKPTPEPDPEALRLAKAAVKGYTLTRQELATVNRNQKEILEYLKKDKEPAIGDDEPVTAGQLKKILEGRETEKTDAKKEALEVIDRQIDDLKAQGIIVTQEDEDELLKYATKHKIRNLSQAATQWQELKEARKGGEITKAKKKVKGKAGAKVGSSQKTKTEKSGEIPYGDIHGKDMEEIIEDE